MKTRNLLLTIGAVALTAITINATASDALLSPRAAGNQIKHVSGTNNDVNPVNTTGITAFTVTARWSQSNASRLLA